MVKPLAAPSAWIATIPAGIASWRKPAVLENTSASNGATAAGCGTCWTGGASAGAACAGAGRTARARAASGRMAAKIGTRDARLRTLNRELLVRGFAPSVADTAEQVRAVRPVRTW